MISRYLNKIIQIRHGFSHKSKLENFTGHMKTVQDGAKHIITLTPYLTLLVRSSSRAHIMALLHCALPPANNSDGIWKCTAYWWKIMNHVIGNITRKKQYHKQMDAWVYKAMEWGFGPLHSCWSMVGLFPMAFPTFPMYSGLPLPVPSLSTCLVIPTWAPPPAPAIMVYHTCLPRILKMKKVLWEPLWLARRAREDGTAHVRKTLCMERVPVSEPFEESYEKSRITIWL